jgi:hypothetical protein
MPEMDYRTGKAISMAAIVERVKKESPWRWPDYHPQGAFDLTTTAAPRQSLPTPSAADPSTSRDNPWTKDGWNVTQQALLIRDDRPRAERLAKEAGSALIPGTTPPGAK